MVNDKITEARKKLEVELKDTVTSIRRLSQDLEALKLKQEQIKGGILALDMVIYDLKTEVKGDQNGEKS